MTKQIINTHTFKFHIKKIITYNYHWWGTRHVPTTGLLVGTVQQLPYLGNDSTRTEDSVVLIAECQVANQA